MTRTLVLAVAVAIALPTAEVIRSIPLADLRLEPGSPAWAATAWEVRLAQGDAFVSGAGATQTLLVHAMWPAC